jgi:hypothetical protein
VFQFPAFTLSPHETERIVSFSFRQVLPELNTVPPFKKVADHKQSTAVRSLLKEGKLTKDPSWDRNWVGAFLVRKLAIAILRDALSNGTLNWDVAVSKVLL